jgi:hypothetical protein
MGIHMHKPWCLLSSSRVGLGNPMGEEAVILKKTYITDIKFISSKT